MCANVPVWTVQCDYCDVKRVEFRPGFCSFILNSLPLLSCLFITSASLTLRCFTCVVFVYLCVCLLMLGVFILQFRFSACVLCVCWYIVFGSFCFIGSIPHRFVHRPRRRVWVCVCSCEHNYGVGNWFVLVTNICYIY